MRILTLVILLMITQQAAHSQQRIFLYPSSEGIIHKGFDTIALLWIITLLRIHPP